jgi:hypothetical protein
MRVGARSHQGVANPAELATAVRSAVDGGKSLVVGVPVDYADYKLLF